LEAAGQAVVAKANLEAHKNIFNVALFAVAALWQMRSHTKRAQVFFQQEKITRVHFSQAVGINSSTFTLFNKVFESKWFTDLGEGVIWHFTKKRQQHYFNLLSGRKIPSLGKVKDGHTLIS
jgi:hypothetical protein